MFFQDAIRNESTTTYKSRTAWNRNKKLEKNFLNNFTVLVEPRI
jgi:hypothetical protein